ncbi:UDP-glucose 4-epimerase [Rhodovastum atsumiense]|uniref:UDP-glucose 4-epimerase n=1 Tax=Rhodovastum atsumiense TaxID=504468 RepID=A0A5M6IUY6_9PROT|nr:UDP-glucose 4-epimerase GalE [Rhodovastum atsumiense]KAA5612082.1 UDP-glucose 4-epimerase GalE [Rhodovastum atsumiense]CAH2604044.1 UDP-glucose 4-epimerase [Rhodovastum atsumiense]
MERRHVLVTGGAGYIGSHACKALAKANYIPVAFDNLALGHEKAVRWGPLVVGDIGDGDSLDRALAVYRPIAVIHFAAFAYVGESVRDPGKYYTNNVSGTLSLLEAMRRTDLRTMVFSSTCATYGEPKTSPIREAEPQAPVNPYGRTKWMIEQILEDYASAYGFQYAALRYFNACGSDPDGEIGEWHDPEFHLIPRAFMAVTGQIPHLEVFGDDYDTPDGTCIRDYIHVNDLARAHIQAVQYLLKGGKNCRLNLGTGQPTSVMEIIRAVERVTGRPLPRRLAPRRPGDPAVLFADPARAREVLGFTAEIKDITYMVQTAWNTYIDGQDLAQLHIGEVFQD